MSTSILKVKSIFSGTDSLSILGEDGVSYKHLSIDQIKKDVKFFSRLNVNTSVESASETGILQYDANNSVNTKIQIKSNYTKTNPDDSRVEIINTGEHSLSGPVANTGKNTFRNSCLTVLTKVSGDSSAEYPFLNIGFSPVNPNQLYTNSAWLQSQDCGNSNSVRTLNLNPIGGNVGVGTLNPLTALHVNGEVRATTTTAGSDPNTLTTKNYVDSLYQIKKITYGTGNGPIFYIYPPPGYTMSNFKNIILSLRDADWNAQLSNLGGWNITSANRADSILVLVSADGAGSASANWLVMWG